MQRTDFINALSRFEYTVNMMCREQIFLMYNLILPKQKNRFNYCEIQPRKNIQIWHMILENMISLTILWENRENFLNSEQKIIYAEKRVNNFFNNDEQKIIFCRMLEKVCAENNE